MACSFLKSTCGRVSKHTHPTAGAICVGGSGLLLLDAGFTFDGCESPPAGLSFLRSQLSSQMVLGVLRKRSQDHSPYLIQKLDIPLASQVWPSSAFSHDQLIPNFFRALQGLGTTAFLRSSSMLMGSVYRPGIEKNVVFPRRVGTFGSFRWSLLRRPGWTVPAVRLSFLDLYKIDPE